MKAMMMRTAAAVTRATIPKPEASRPAPLSNLADAASGMIRIVAMAVKIPAIRERISALKIFLTPFAAFSNFILISPLKI